MRCLIVDDDNLMIHILEALLSEVDYVESVSKANNVKEAINFLHKEEVDLIFLDIEMPEINGIEFLKIFSKQSVKVIIVSSHKEYAFDAFEYDVIDYLLKPIDKKRLLKSLVRANESIMDNIHSQENIESFYIKTNTTYQSIYFDKILYVESLGDYVCIVMNDKKVTVRTSLKKIEEKLPKKHFYRVHNSFIIRLDKIEKYEDYLIIIKKAVIPVSRAQKAGLNQRLNIL